MAETEKTPPPEGERLAKVIARAGLCSRRDAEKWIADGRVSVDGRTIDTPAFNVTDDNTVLVDGNPLAARHGTRLWLYHKPPGLVVTEKDPEGRETIFEKLAEEGLPRVVTVGRLDINTEGLLLLTNDGGLKRVLELPATGWLRKYRVRAFGSIDQAQLDTLKNGMTVDGLTYGPIEATLERVQGGNVWLLVSLREGKNREVKNVLGALGLQVNRLIRVSYGPFQLGDLAIGAVSVVKARVLREQLGEKLARQAGVDFDSALPEDSEPKDYKDGKKNQKNSRDPNDPNARLGRRPPRAAKPSPAPKPRTGEPRFAKQRATGKGPVTPPEAPTVKRRILFDDGTKLVEDTGKPQRDKGFGDARRGPPRDGGKPGARPDRPRRDDKDGPRPAGRPRQDDRNDARSSGKPRGASGGPRPQGRPGGKPFGASGASRPQGRPAGKPGGRKPGSFKPKT